MSPTKMAGSKMAGTNCRVRSAVIAGSAPGAILLVGALVIAAAGSTPADADAGKPAVRTAVAVSRTLSTTLTAAGTIESVGNVDVVQGRTAAVPEDTGPKPANSNQIQVQAHAPTLTALARTGTRVTTGTELYATDGDPVIAIIAGTPSWRVLRTGVPDGSDVRTLEKALTTLGYGKGVTVDDHFGPATADAVRTWEKHLHRADPDGVVSPDEILLLARPGQVVDRPAQPGQAVPAGTRLLTVALTRHVVTVNVQAEDVASWHPGAVVTVRRPDGSTAGGRVSTVGTDVVGGTDGEGGTVQVTVVPRTGRFAGRAGTSADVILVTRRRKKVLAVPVAALHDDSAGRPAVTVISDGVPGTRPVSLGLVAQGWVQVTAGLRAGERVQLPG